jgi:hypothetical protein
VCVHVLVLLRNHVGMWGLRCRRPDGTSLQPCIGGSTSEESPRTTWAQQSISTRKWGSLFGPTWIHPGADTF